MIFPPAVRPGDRIRVIAPSGPFDRSVFQHGLTWLSQRYDVIVDPGIYDRQGFLAGSDARRLSELNAALQDRQCRAIIVARGGHGLTRIVHRADFAALRDNPKWLVGFSDGTLLHIEASRWRTASIHAPNVTGLGRIDDRGREAFAEHLEAPCAARRFTDLGVWREGVARGPLFGGNLTLLMTSSASGRLHVPKGAILFLEDVGEAPYRVDRMLSALWVSGALQHISGVVIGEMTRCDPGTDGTSIETVLQERLTELGVPVLYGLPVGHGERNASLTFGLNARIDSTERSLSFAQET